MKTHLLAATGFLLAAASVSAAPLTLTNANFESGFIASTDNPVGWTTTEVSGNSVYLYQPTAAKVAAFWGSGGELAQSFSTSEAFADTYGNYAVTFDSGWRNNSPGLPFALTFSLVNITDGSVLGSSTYNFPASTPSLAFDNYRVIATGNTLNIAYDNTTANLVGKTVGLRITATSGDSSGFNTTGWIDNIAVNATAVPEPSTYGLLGAGALAGVAMLRRRRRA